MSELKNCPCCGEKAECSQVILMFEAPGDVKERIKCKGCGLTIEDSFGMAKDKWNARVEHSTQLKSEDTTNEH